MIIETKIALAVLAFFALRSGAGHTNAPEKLTSNLNTIGTAVPSTANNAESASRYVGGGTVSNRIASGDPQGNDRASSQGRAVTQAERDSVMGILGNMGRAGAAIATRGLSEKAFSLFNNVSTVVNTHSAQSDESVSFAPSTQSQNTAHMAEIESVYSTGVSTETGATSFGGVATADFGFSENGIVP